MPATTIPYAPAEQQPQVVSTSVLQTPLVCSWCSQSYDGPYDCENGVERPQAAPSFCFWPFEHPRQSHGICAVCRDLYLDNGIENFDPILLDWGLEFCDFTLMDWTYTRLAHVERAKEIMVALLSPQSPPKSPRKRRRGAA